MRILLDENIPADLASLLAGHIVETVHSAGWAGVRNGTLLRLAAAAYDMFVTMDRSIEYQQNYPALALGIVVVRAKSNRMADLESLVPAIQEAVRSVKPGQLLIVQA